MLICVKLMSMIYSTVFYFTLLHNKIKKTPLQEHTICVFVTLDSHWSIALLYDQIIMCNDS